MKVLSTVVVALVSLYPMSARAQSVTLSKLVGAWVGGRVDSTGTLVKFDTLVIQSDSTYRKSPDLAFSLVRLRDGDSLAFFADLAKGSPVPPGKTGNTWKVTLEGNDLTLTRRDAALTTLRFRRND